MSLSVGHERDKAAIAEADGLIHEIDKKFYDFAEKVHQLKSKLEAKKATSIGKNDAFDNERFQNKLDMLSSKIITLRNYLHQEKSKDGVLRKQSNEAMNSMSQEKNNALNVRNNMIQLATGKVNDFSLEIEEVNAASLVEIKSDGAVMVGGVGSPCVPHADQCVDTDSECRNRKCQCLPGKSYDLKKRRCVDTCDKYGNTFQAISYYVIRGHNDLVLNDTSLAHCTAHCNQETAFLCRSFDYFPAWQQCFLSARVKTEVDDKAWEYNSEGYHFQRDCF